MSFEAALAMSLERLELIANANARREARMILKLAQTINAGGMTGSSDDYAALQRQLIKQTQIGIE